LRTIAFYISGHGFGHASRDIEVINALLAAHADLRVVARTTVPAWLFARTVVARPEGRALSHLRPEGRALSHLRPEGRALGRRFTRFEVETDTGAAQIDSLHVDERLTVQRAREYMRTFDNRVAVEVEFLREHDARVVVFDVPPLAVAAAKGAGIPAVALGNFTWDWIYAGYAGAEDVVRCISDVYADSDVAFRLPMHGGFESFATITDVPFIARRSSRSPEETRQALGLPRDRRLVLLSFGGYGLDRIDQQALDALTGYAVIGSTAHPLNEDAMDDNGFRYEDLVRAVDVVVTKPGYGIISECVANQTAILYTSRGRFAEYDVLVREMPRYARARFIDHEDLFAGRWQTHLDGLLAQPAPPEHPRVDGAAVVAHRILGMI
jgi:L-arabinokinase